MKADYEAAAISKNIALGRHILLHYQGGSRRAVNAALRAVAYGIARDWTISEFMEELQKPSGGRLQFARQIGPKTLSGLREMFDLKQVELVEVKQTDDEVKIGVLRGWLNAMNQWLYAHRH